MKTLIYILSTTLSLVATPVEAKPQILSGNSAKQIETSFNKTNGNGHQWKLQSDQAFEIDLNSGTLSHAVFAPFKDNEVQFVLLKAGGGGVLQILPKSDLAVVSLFSFKKVNAVSFKDINGDGTKDIFVMASYFDSRPVQGDGIGGGTTKVGFAFISNKDQFSLDENCGEDIGTLAELEKCVRKKP
ncbi:MAG: hypothetical protein EOP05_23560 [Proteobacteria bacterium]|nr:MAG: hypothetical protein EOP05_23560 [Pseudomonadota bacterium]